MPEDTAKELVELLFNTSGGHLLIIVLVLVMVSVILGLWFGSKREKRSADLTDQIVKLQVASQASRDVNEERQSKALETIKDAVKNLDTATQKMRDASEKTALSLGLIGQSVGEVVEMVRPMKDQVQSVDDRTARIEATFKEVERILAQLSDNTVSIAAKVNRQDLDLTATKDNVEHILQQIDIIAGIMNELRKAMQIEEQ